MLKERLEKIRIPDQLLSILVLPVFHVTHLLDVLTWLAGLAVLYRKPREYVVTIMISLGVAVIYQMIFPYFG